MAKYKLGGFLFETQEEAQRAKKELENIRYLRSKTNMNDPDATKKLYDRLIEQNYFETPVGIEFLRDIQAYLGTIPLIRKEDIAPIPVPGSRKEELASVQMRSAALSGEKEAKRAQKEAHRYKKLFMATGILSVLLLCVVIGIFAITYISGTDINIYNYEQQVIDKYEAWESELDAREKELNQREKELDSRSAEDISTTEDADDTGATDDTEGTGR